ncbi:MAG: DNA polymerase I [Erysipelotrichaceae bacterium]|nr:DNA polymerase I [Erysipelotrichaceae bacterium]
MKLLLIDGNSVLFRAFYATSYGNIMKTSKGVYTNAVYAFANMLNKAIKTIAPDYCAVAFDMGKHTFRHDFAPDYKAGRRETPEELVGQFSLVREMLEAYKIPYFEFDTIEADDIIGSLAKKYQIETCVLSSDRDMLQLIDDTTSVYVMKKGMSEIAKMDEAALKEEYGLKPYQIIDYKGLAGDKSDNIKGVEGVGEKTAVKLLNDFDTCEGVYEHIDEIKGKLKDKLIKDKDSCFLSKRLATIKTDVDIEGDLEDLRLSIDEQGRNDFFEKYEMYSLIRKVDKKDVSEEKKEIRIVSALSEELLEDALVYFVSDEFSYYQRKIRGACFANDQGEVYISLEDLKKDEKALAYLASDRKKTFFDLKAVKHALEYNGIALGQGNDDVCLMCFLSNNYNTDLKAILANYEYGPLKEAKDLFGTEKKPLEPTVRELAEYGTAVASALYQIAKKVKNELSQKQMDDLYGKIELPLVDVLFDMEKQGVYCDEKELDETASATKKKIDLLEEKIYLSVGHEFNIASTKQLAEVLYKELDLPDLKKGSTSADVLSKLVDYHPAVSDILEYRKYSKLYSTYAEGLKKYIREDGKIHTVFTQMITATGRLSSYDPNLQNISVRDDEGREIRKAFKPSKGNVLISSDYSQVELRVLSSLADEEKMIDAFNSGIDIHTKTAMDVFGLKKEEVTDIVRRHAKAVNFGVVYGISDFGLANQTQLSFKDAKKFIDDYFLTYPNIRDYLDAQVAFCKENGYVKTMLNRRRYINEINDRNYMMREFGKRAAMNASIQGSAADLIKIAMVNAHKKLREEGLSSKLILQVHDELIFDVPEEEVETMKKIIPEIMANAYPMKTRLDSSLAIGKDWYEAK